MEVARKPTSFLENFTTYLMMSMSVNLLAKLLLSCQLREGQWLNQR